MDLGHESGEFVSLLLAQNPGAGRYDDAEEEKRVSLFEATTDAGLERLAAQCQQRLRDSMRERNTPVLLILDSVNTQQATGASNMTIFFDPDTRSLSAAFRRGPEHTL